MTSYKDLANMAAQTDDQTETKTSGEFEYVPPKAGPCGLRFVGYVELGMQPQKPFQGKPKPDAEEVRVTFELLGKNYRKTDDDGKEHADLISIRMTKSLGEKARFKKLFNAMAQGRADIKHMAQMLGEGFLGEVYHNDNGKTGPEKKVYANLDKDGAWSIKGPYKTDELEGTRTPIKLPDPLNAPKIFLWDHPTKACWDSLFIDGKKTIKVDGKEEEVSKNYWQELILSAKNYKGSPLHAMLNDVGDLPLDEKPADAEKKSASSATDDATKTSSPSKTVVETADSDDLAALGL